MLELTKNQLAEIRNKFNCSDSETKRNMFKTAALFSFLSIQTKVDKHELSFKLIMDKGLNDITAGDICRLFKAAKIPFYNYKSVGILNLISDIDNLDVRQINLRFPNKTRQYCVEHLRGLGYTKVSFTLALLGFNVACIDTHMADSLKLAELWHKDKEVIRKQISKSKKLYESAERLIKSRDKFIWQWESFERELGETITHEVYFNVQSF